MSEQVETKYDAIVVGSGPGGGSVARDLTLQGKRVLILEWGPDLKLEGKLSQYIRYGASPPHSMVVTSQGLGIVRGMLMGGSSIFYYGTCFPVPVQMLRAHGVDLQQEMETVRQELPIGPLKDEMFTPMAARIMQSAQDLGYNWQKLDKFMFQDRWQPGMKFGYYGDPHDVKWSSKMLVEQAVQKGATLLDHARVERVLVEGNTATGVEYRHRGKKANASADRIIVAAGGIGTPLILRRSGIEEAGYDFFFDPLVTACGTVSDLRAGDEIPMSAGVHMSDEGYVMTDMALPPALDSLFSLSVMRVHRAFSQGRMLRIMIKIKDDLAGKITDGGGVRKSLTKDDKHKLRSGYERAKKILENAGAKGVFKTVPLAAHPGGTAKIGQVVNTDLKSLKYDNLYVCDCSVIPEPWGLPPVFTIICLGKRLARHLA